MGQHGVQMRPFQGGNRRAGDDHGPRAPAQAIRHLLRGIDDQAVHAVDAAADDPRRLGVPTTVGTPNHQGAAHPRREYSDEREQHHHRHKEADLHRQPTVSRCGRTHLGQTRRQRQRVGPIPGAHDMHR